MLGRDPNAPKYAQDLAEAERLFRETRLVGPGLHGVDPRGVEQPDVRGCGSDPEGLARGLNPNFRINVLIVPEARFDEAHGTVPFEYPMWIKNADLFADPHQMMMTYFHPDGEWGQTLGFAEGMRTRRDR